MDLRRFGLGQYVKDSEIDEIGNYAQAAEVADHVDLGFVGVLSGLVVSQHYAGTTLAPNLTVDVSAGAARDETGLRMPLVAGTSVDCSLDHLGASTAVSSGKHRCVSVFAKQAIVETEVFTKKNGADIYRKLAESISFEVWMGAETLLASPLDYPVLMAGYVLLADITLINGQTQIVTGDISTARRQDQVVIAGSPYSSRRGRLLDAISDAFSGLNDLVVDLASSGGAALIGAAARAAWLNGTTNPAGTVQAALAKIITDLNSEVTGDDGASKIGVDAITGTQFYSVAGSLRALLSGIMGRIDQRVFSDKVVASYGVDAQIRGDASNGIIVRNEVGGYMGVECAERSTRPYAAINDRWIQRAAVRWAGAAQSLTHDAHTQLNWDTEDWDFGGLYPATGPNTHRFEIKEAGVYRVCAEIWFAIDSITWSYIVLEIDRSGTIVATRTFDEASWRACVHSIETDVDLSVGHVVSVYVTQSNNADVARDVVAGSRFWIKKVSNHL